MTVKEDGMRALAIAETADHVCGRYRLRAFAPTLAQAGWSLSIEGIAEGVMGRFRQCEHAREFDAVILQRKLLPAWQLAHLRRRSRTLIFDFDDAVLYRDSNDPRGPHCPRRSSRFRRTMEIADVVIAGNDFLADCALSHGASADRIRVIPTCVDTAKYRPLTERARPEPFDLTWIGSSSTLRGLEAQRAIWERVGREILGSRLRLISDRFPKFDALEVSPVPWTEATEAAELAKASVGVSWIPEGLWSRGKCGLKVLQYQAAGLPVVANPVGVHPEMIRPSETGFLAESAEDWVAALRALANLPEERSRMGIAARRFVERHYSINAWASAFVAAIVGHPAPPNPKSRVPRQVGSSRPLTSIASRAL